MTKTFYNRLYIAGHYLAAIIAWLAFFIWRKTQEVETFDWGEITNDAQLYYGLLVIPIIWLFSFWYFGCYEHIIRRSRLKDLALTFIVVSLGCLVMLFGVIYDDLILRYHSYVSIFGWLWGIHFLTFAAVKVMIMSIIKHHFHHDRIKLNRVIWKDWPSVTVAEKIEIVDDKQSLLQRKEYMDSIWITTESELNNLVAFLSGYVKNIGIKVHANLVDQLTLPHSISPTINEDYYYVEVGKMSYFSINTKRLGDIFSSIVGLIIFSPLLVYCAIRVRRSSSGPIFYQQKRVGRYGVPFIIYKFRSMIENAEVDGAQLAAVDDKRCTSWGLTMRKWRLDELPQLFNVLRGDMSIVGPRPERSFYINQLKVVAPEYPLVLITRPGMTSWGQMRFGYARNIEEMKQRLRFDLLYVHHQSLLLDLKIILLTIYKLLTGQLR